MTALWIILGILAAYIIISIPVYFLMKYLYEKKGVKVLPNVKYKWLWYLIHFTWSLPMTLFGCIVALILVCRGHKPKIFGWCWCFELDTGWGMEMGIFFIGKSKSTKKHEHGHAIQNIYLGPFAVTCVSIPSAIRFWTRELRKKKNPEIKLESYDKAWFEGQATKSGNAFIKQIESK
jgi:hypothetical protein